MNKNKIKSIFGAIRLVGVAALILFTLSFSAQAAIYPEAKIIQLSNDSNVNVTFEGASSAYNDMFGLYDPTYRELFWGHTSSPGTKFNLGSFPAGTELVFFIRSPGGIAGTPSAIFKTGPASRNPDNQVHGAITDLGDQTWRIGFEDLWGGGDRDYNDIQVLVKGDLYMIQPNPLKPDLLILQGDISFSNNNPAPGEIVEIQASIRNFGKSISSNVVMAFYDGNPDAGGQLITTETINGISKEEKITRTVIWDTTGKTGA